MSSCFWHKARGSLIYILTYTYEIVSSHFSEISVQVKPSLVLYGKDVNGAGAGWCMLHRSVRLYASFREITIVPEVITVFSL